MTHDQILQHNRETNPFRPRTLKWALYCEDFSDLTASQVAEIFDCDISIIRDALYGIFKKTGYRVRLAADKRGPKTA